MLHLVALALATVVGGALVTCSEHAPDSTPAPARTETATEATTQLPRDIQSGWMDAVLVQRLVAPDLVFADQHSPACIRLPLRAGLSPGSDPEYFPGTRYAADVALARRRYLTAGIEFAPYLQQYSAEGDFLNYGLLLRYEADPTIRFDSAGMPMIAYDGVYHYNPVTLAEFALTLHGRYLHGTGTLNAFLNAADFLISREGPDGAFRFPFAYTYYLAGTLQPGWVSALAQGLALSVFARAYSLTGDATYAEAGRAALNFLLIPTEDAGVRHTLHDVAPGLSEFAWFQEYPTDPPYYTLNGFMYTLLGLYDWSVVDASDAQGSGELAGEWSECGLASLVYILPYYDVGGFSAYDLGHIVAGVRPNLQADYHAIHIYLLYALQSIAPNLGIQEYLQRWSADVS